MKSEQLAYFNRDHAWFVAYAPVQNPKIAVGDFGRARRPWRGRRRSFGEKSDREIHGASKPGHLSSNRPASKEQLVQIDRRLVAHFDWTLFLLALVFVAIGVTTIYSANYNIAEEHAGGLPSRQLLWLGLGIIAMLTAVAFDYHYLDRLAYPFYGAMLLLLLSGSFRRTFRRWIAALDQPRIFPVATFGARQTRDCSGDGKVSAK